MLVNAIRHYLLMLSITVTFLWINERTTNFSLFPAIPSLIPLFGT